MILLYAECIEEEPVYVPRKFRQDSYHTNSQAERNVINTSNLQRFQTECEILRIRREQYMKEITSKDDYIKNFINNQPFGQQCILELLDLYLIEINRDIDKINSDWSKKIDSTRKAFNVDKDKQANHHNLDHQNENAVRKETPVLEIHEHFNDNQINNTYHQFSNNSQNMQQNQDQNLSKNYDTRQRTKKKYNQKF